ncbi:MAG: hypothetical protein JWM68_2349 [Verrucomicrobiales bacterium]|nr:hypothetical protein [Verrucomicrobiales bacterium]
MKFKAAAFIAIALLAATSPSANAVALTSNAAGQELAAQLRNAPPSQGSEVSGVLKITFGTNRVEIPVRAQAITEDDKWKTIYTTSSVKNIPAMQIVVIHSSNAPNQYSYARATDTNSVFQKPIVINSQVAAETSLAGSDFTIADLGMDFLHWPEQIRLTATPRLGRDCYLLESRNPAAKEMVRVKSWIDKESEGVGLLVAEGYNAKDEKVKVFSLSGSSFKKVNGRMQLEKMTIRSPKKSSETVLQFDLQK